MTILSALCAVTLSMSKREIWSSGKDEDFLSVMQFVMEVPRLGLKAPVLLSRALSLKLLALNCALSNRRNKWNLKYLRGLSTLQPVDGILVQFSSVTQLCPTLWDPMDCSTPDFPVHHQLPEPTQTHVHCIGDTLQPSHPPSSPSPVFNLFQHQGLFQWVDSASGGQSIVVSASASVLPMNIQDWFPSGLTSWTSLQAKGLLRVFSNTTVQKDQFFDAQLSL